MEKKKKSTRLTRRDIELSEMFAWQKMFLSRKGKKESLKGYV